jgi:hypothetical protein
VLPLLVALWQTDATVRAGITQQIQTTWLGTATAGMLTGGELSLDARAQDAETAYDLRAAGRYAHMFAIAPAGDAGPRAGNLGLSILGGAGYQLSPRARITIDALGVVTSRFGMPALEGPALIDPFLSGNRVAYTAGSGLTLTTSPSKRETLRLGAGYQQDGGIAAEVPEAVGVNPRTGRAEAAWGWDAGPDDTITPELRLSLTHYEHAILDVELHRGRADVRAGTASLGLMHAFDRRIAGTASLGLTVAGISLAETGAAPALVASPDARASLSCLGKRWRVAADYAFAFTSLGARVAFGRQHTAGVDLSMLPLPGGQSRDLVLHATARIALGTAEIALPAAPGSTAPAGTGTITTTILVAGGLAEVPIARGVAFTGGVDLLLSRGTIDPAPIGGSPGPQLGAILSFGIAGTLSTDPARTVRPDPQAEEDQARARARGVVDPADRRVDRDRWDGARRGEGDPELLDTDREDERERAKERANDRDPEHD